jgi:hypothetical protein
MTEFLIKSKFNFSQSLQFFSIFRNNGTNILKYVKDKMKKLDIETEQTYSERECDCESNGGGLEEITCTLLELCSV